jgi:predicted DCC family thiol-disulfide oxidoreductase YuxK
MVMAGDPTEKLSIVGFTDPLFRTLLADMPEEQRLASMHIVDERGRVHSAGRAVMLLLSLTGTRKQRWQMRLARLLPPVRNKIESEYQRLASRRAELSGKVDDVAPVHRPPKWYRP